MSNFDTIGQQLITLSRSLGEPSRDLAILGEGNTSAKLDDDLFLVKASGYNLASLDEEGLITVRYSKLKGALDGEPVGDARTREILLNAREVQEGSKMPSVETYLHGFLLSLPDIMFVGHTHPTAVNALSCSVNAQNAFSGMLFPDEIVSCGVAVCYVEYTDPGIVLAQYLRRKVLEFVDRYDAPPRVIVMQNHGLIATGKTPTEVENATIMFVKACRVRLGTYAAGGPHFLPLEHVNRIHTRPDEHYRKRLIG